MKPKPRQDLFAHFEDEEAVETPLPKRHQKQQLPKEYVPGLVVETRPGFCDVMCGDDRIRCRAGQRSRVPILTIPNSNESSPRISM